jgi:amidohydrolase
MKISESKLQELITFRRAIHSHPELMFEEIKTAELVSEHLTKLNLNFERGIAKTGITCLLDSGIPGKTLLVRADMDALPIHEENQVSYRSRNTGIMHACGHDGHTAILMSLAGDLKAQISNLIPKGRVLLVFQPAEEGGGGADKMIEEGILEKYNVSAALALHVWNHVPLGKIGVVEGPMMAAVDEFNIKVIGKSGHGAMPQHTVDPIVVSAHIITALQSIVSRFADPLDSCVVTVGSLHSGDAFNAIPEVAYLKGTVRTYSKELYNEIPEKLKNIINGISEGFGARAEIEYLRINKPTINETGMVNIVKKASDNILGSGNITTEHVKNMGGEDFSAFLDRVPGCYFFVGSRNPDKGFIHPHHNSKFDFDETALPIGLEVLKESIRLYLSEN